MALVHDKDFDPRYGEAVQVAPGVRRLTAPNAGPFSFHGTNSYLVGERDIVVIDPGPDNPSHIEDIVNAAGRDRIAAILVSHTHADHSPGTRLLKEITGAPVYAEGPHRAARPLNIGEVNPLDASCDIAFKPDHTLKTGDNVTFADTTLTALETPGHCANHLAFALEGTDILFSADHVMAWSTSIVAPPDGAMADYMASLDMLLRRNDSLYLPGHGGAVTDPATYVADLKTHRLGREKAVLDRLAAGDRSIGDMVKIVYKDVDPRLHPAAALSMLAHLEDLVARGLVKTDGPASLDARYEPVA